MRLNLSYTSCITILLEHILELTKYLIKVDTIGLRCTNIFETMSRPVKVVKKEGNIWFSPDSEFEIKGQVRAEDGAIFCLHTAAKLSESSLKNIVISGKPMYKDNERLKLGFSGCRSF